MTQRQILLTLTISLAMAASAAAQSNDVHRRTFPVSLIRIIANPEKFTDQNVRVVGFLDYGGGPDASVCLYVSELDARNHIWSNCVPLHESLDRNDKRLGKYVILTATLHYLKGSGIDFIEFEHVSEMHVWSKD